MIETIEIKCDRAEARLRYAAYLKALREKKHTLREHRRRDEAAKLAFLELSRGRKVIDLKKTIANAGVDDQNRPLLAAIRADATRCQYRCWGNRSEPTFAVPTAGRWDKESAKIKSVIQMPPGSLPEFYRPIRGGKHWPTLTAIVPMVPPELRPEKTRLSGLVILWEADWEDAPIDPLLLRPLGGDIYSVLAAWDLTEVERGVLRGDFE